MMKKYKKIDYEDIYNENCEIKDYIKTMTVPDARLKFKLKAKVCPKIKMNFQSDKNDAKELWLYNFFSYADSQTHVAWHCPEYSLLRENLDLNNNADLIYYFREVIKLRDDQSP